MSDMNATTVATEPDLMDPAAPFMAALSELVAKVEMLKTTVDELVKRLDVVERAAATNVIDRLKTTDLKLPS